MSCRSGAVRRGEQGPLAVFHHPLHEQVRHPVGRVHVVGAAAVVAGVLAQLQELLDVQMPGLEVGAHRALALAALIDRHRRVVHHFQERHDALGLAVGALDVGAERPHRGPVVAQPAGELGQQRVFLDGVVDAVQVVGDRGQVAARQLGAVGAGVEQGRGRAHEVEARQHVVELDGAGLAVALVERQAHRHAHEEGLGQLDAPAADVDEVAVVERLQAEVAELEVAVRVQRLRQRAQVEGAQARVEQAGGDALLDEPREVLGVARVHLGMGELLAQHLHLDAVQQQAGGDVAVGRVLLDQGARRQDGALAHLLHRHAVVEVLEDALQDHARHRPRGPVPRRNP